MNRQTPRLNGNDLRATLEPVLSGVFSEDLSRAYWHIDRLCLHFCYHIAHARKLLEFPIRSPAQLADRLGIAPEAIYLVGTVLDILCEEGVAKRTHNGIEAARQYPRDDSDRLQIEARRDCPGADPTLDLIARCREHTLDFIAGKESGLAAVFPYGDFALWERLHSTDRVMSIYADLVPPVLAAVLRPGMGILEIGGGVAAVLKRSVAALDAHDIRHYLFTDVGQSFVQAAQRRFDGDKRIGFAKLDINLPLAEQGLASGSFDIVIGVNVAHVAKHLLFSLRELFKVLKPNGFLVLSEGSPPDLARRWRLDLMFAFLRGWWDVTIEPPWRMRQGFLLPSEWKAALLASGFEDVHLLPGEGWFRGACRGGAIVAARL